jgi:aminoglycoside phosphotransferase (APT) family kinase protein
VEQLEVLVWDEAVLRGDHPGGLTDKETSQLRELVPQIRELLQQLEAEVGPASLVHQDFRGGNVALVGDDYLFFDWGNTAVGHPFFSGVNFLHHSRYPIPTQSVGVSGAANGPTTCSGETLERYLRDAYLEPWTIRAPGARLREAFELARRVWYVWLAVQFHQELPYVEPTAALGMEVRYSIPSFLRRVIRAFTAAEDTR